MTLVKILGVTLFIGVFVGLSWKLWTRTRDPAVLVPSGRFWRVQTASEAFWNREQQHLDWAYSPISNPGGPPAAGPPGRCRPDRSVPGRVADFNALPQRFRDFLVHMRCRTHRLLLDQPRACAASPFLLLAVKSLAPHFDRRQAIRETWGRAGRVANRTVVTLFLLGRAAPEDHFPDLQGLLVQEARLHRDLLQWDYRDSFFNLTLKDVLFLDWFRGRCPQARYVLKGDDDVFVNTPRVLALLAGLPPARARDLFLGDVINGAGPHRDRRLKYFVPESVFVGEYPPYAGGGGYLLSGELAVRLQAASRRVALFPIDDVYTGLCLRKLGVAPEGHAGFRTFGIQEASRADPCVHRGLMLVHSRSPQEMLAIWPWVAHPERDCQ